MAAQLDRRIEKTRAALLQAMSTLMASIGWRRSSIQKICDEANISRSTFYMHFNNKQELLEYAFDQLKAHLELHPPERGIDRNGTLAFLPSLLEHVYSHKDIFKANLLSSTEPQVFHQFKKFIYEFGEQEIKNSALSMRLRDDQIAFIFGGVFSVIEQWSIQDCSTPIHLVLERIDASVSDFLINPH